MLNKEDWDLLFTGNVASFSGAVRQWSHRKFLVFVNDLERRGYEEIVLDFSGCAKTAFPNSMVPIVAGVQALIGRGIKTECILPNDDTLRRLFLRNNWAHYLDPVNFHPSDDISHRHLAVRQFTTPQEQQAVVNGFIDVTMRTLELDRSILAGLEWSVNEITDNVLNHANAPLGGFIQLEAYRENQIIAFCVADTGRGILKSLQEAMPNLRSHEMAIGQAVRAGVTRNKDFGQGNGLSGSLKIATSTKGWFRIASGSADVTWKEKGLKNFEERKYEPKKHYDGTIVDVQISTNSAIDLARVLSDGTNTPNYKPSDRIELHYLSDDAKKLRLPMKDETDGFGSRHAGEQVRVKCKNLMSAEPTCLPVIDWDGIQLIASSYADEFIGKMFVELGPMEFMAKVCQVNVMPVVQQLINRAIMQRTNQTMTGQSGD